MITFSGDLSRLISILKASWLIGDLFGVLPLTLGFELYIFLAFTNFWLNLIFFIFIYGYDWSIFLEFGIWEDAGLCFLLIA